MPSHLLIRPARAVRGTLRAPGDKSISHRYVMLGAIADGTTTVEHLAPGADVAATIACLQALGASIEAGTPGPGAIRVHGRGSDGLVRSPAPLDAANSGTTLRLLAGIVAGRPFRTTLLGDASLSRRPMRRIVDPLVAMGARISTRDGCPPLVIDGGHLNAVSWETPVASAQVKSAILLAGLSAQGVTSVVEPLATRDHTERAFRAFGLEIVVDESRRAVSVIGGQRATAPAAPLRVPGDPSSAAVWAAAAAALPGSSVELDGLCLNPRRLGFVHVLERMGASILASTEGDESGEPVGRLTVRHGTHGSTVIAPAEVPSLIDELPVLAARAALGGALEVSGAGELRVKESDRIAVLVSGLRTLGVDASEQPDGFTVIGNRRPTGGTVDAAGDHRLVMAFALVGLGASGPTTITGADAVAVSYPDFARDLARLTS